MSMLPANPASGPHALAAQARAELRLVQELLSLQTVRGTRRASPERLECLSAETRHYLQAVLKDAGDTPRMREITANLPRFSITHWLHEATKDLSADSARLIQREMLHRYAQALEQAPTNLPPHRRQELAIGTLGAALEAHRRVLLSPRRVRWVLYTTIGWVLWLVVAQWAFPAMLFTARTTIGPAFLLPLLSTVIVWWPQGTLLAKGGLERGWGAASLLAFSVGTVSWLILLAPRWLDLRRTIRPDTIQLLLIEFAAFLFVGVALGVAQAWRLRHHLQSPWDWFIWAVLGWMSGGLIFLYMVYNAPLLFGTRHIWLAAACAAAVQSAINSQAFRHWSGRVGVSREDSCSDSHF